MSIEVSLIVSINLIRAVYSWCWKFDVHENYQIFFLHTTYNDNSMVVRQKYCNPPNIHTRIQSNFFLWSYEVCLICSDVVVPTTVCDFVAVSYDFRTLSPNDVDGDLIAHWLVTIRLLYNAEERWLLDSGNCCATINVLLINC